MSISDDVQRVHFFNGQLLEADDFTAEQEYHIKQRRQHNRELHTWGIVKGLDVTPVLRPNTSDVKEVIVTPGLAVDCAGCEIDIREPASFDLSDFDENKVIYIVAKYRELIPDTAGNTVAGDGTRIKESGHVDKIPEKDADEGTQLILAGVTRRGKTVDINGKKRRLAGVKSDSLRVTRLTLTTDTRKDSEDDAVWEARSDRGVRLNGNLDVDGGLTLTGKSEFKKNVSIGEEDPAIVLDKNGTINAKNLILDGTPAECFTSPWFYVDKDVPTPNTYPNPFKAIPSGFQMFCSPDREKGDIPTETDPQVLVNVMSSEGKNGYWVEATAEHFKIYAGTQSIAVRVKTDKENGLVPKEVYKGYYRFVCWKNKEKPLEVRAAGTS